MLSIQKGVFIICLLLVFVSCDNKRYEVNTANLPVNSEQFRLDVELQQDINLETTHKRLLEEHPNFYPTYFNDILQLGDPSQPSAHENLSSFLNDPIMTEIQSEIIAGFGKETIFRSKLEDAFKRMAYFFPNDTIPDVHFYNSGFNYGIYPTPKDIGVGLEWYIGTDNKILERLPPSQFPQYLREKMNSNYIVPDIIRGFLLVRHSDKIDGKELVQQLVYFGKIAFVTDVILPDDKPFLRYGYKAAELEWCENNEFNIWKALVNDDLLYSKDRKMINSFIGNAPFTKGFSEESPGKIAFFIGKKMVEDFLNAQEEMSLDQLMNISSSEILKSYRPNK